MKTDLSSKTKIRVIPPLKDATTPSSSISEEIPTASENVDFLERAKTAIAEKDESKLQWLQLEAQIKMIEIIQNIDWKAWEFYKKTFSLK